MILLRMKKFCLTVPLKKKPAFRGYSAQIQSVSAGFSAFFNAFAALFLGRIKSMLTFF